MSEEELRCLEVEFDHKPAYREDPNHEEKLESISKTQKRRGKAREEKGQT
jgi:hypothetical protein